MISEEVLETISLGETSAVQFKEAERVFTTMMGGSGGGLRREFIEANVLTMANLDV